MGEILKIENLKTYFTSRKGIVKAVDDISFTVSEREVLGLVGESGSGKSMTCRSILRLVPPPGEIVSGKIYYGNEDIMSWSENRLTQYRGAEVSMILQEPMTALNPVHSVGMQIIETILQHENISKKEAENRAVDLLRMVGIPAPQRRLREYPHQFSGGMRQRVMIAISLACRPNVLLADEPTTALDVTIQDQIIRLIRNLQEEMGMSVVWVTHDLGIVAQLCDQVAVMYAGHIVEMTNVIELFENSRHPYTIGLMESVPSGKSRHLNQLVPIQGQPPDLLNLPPGCPFRERCRYAIEACAEGGISLQKISADHYSACIRYEELKN